MAKTNYKIPFDKNGNQMDYEGYGLDEMVDNFEFEDTLTFQSYGRGRSSVTFTFKRVNGKTVSMFVSDFADIVGKMNHGHITGRFTFSKKGQNYGCKMVSP